MKVFTAKKISALAVMAALLVVGKLALTMIPNVEVVSLFCAVFGYVFGFIAAIPTLIFTLILGAYWGFNTWVITYIIHFTAISVVFALLSKKNIDKPYIVAPIIAVQTFVFGLIDAFLVTVIGGADGFLYRFTFYYGNGFVFVLIHICSNFVIFLMLFKPLATLTKRLTDKLKI